MVLSPEVFLREERILLFTGCLFHLRAASRYGILLCLFFVFHQQSNAHQKMLHTYDMYHPIVCRVTAVASSLSFSLKPAVHVRHTVSPPLKLSLQPGATIAAHKLGLLLHAARAMHL